MLSPYTNYQKFNTPSPVKTSSFSNINNQLSNFAIQTLLKNMNSPSHYILLDTSNNVANYDPQGKNDDSKINLPLLLHKLPLD